MSNILKDYQSETSIDFTKNERENVEIIEDEQEEITENDPESEEMDLDATAVICAILHDTVEDTYLSLDDIKDLFGSI